MITRFIFKEIKDDIGNLYTCQLFALYADEDVPKFVGTVNCPEARDLILQAPALDQLRRANKRIDSMQKRELRIREYKDKTSDFIAGMAKWIKKL